ncbi:MAG: hypothetical protein A2788_00320 [Candidatus Abawacabacteria bacterium RIFCSPHIGHO2_01_FULL_46_8]|uniref:Response regulatory domain-containing protein n=1 Tax=Candidatus Abawacabacteria bacterium RIFCSPHIGHO2_01_FULL_46_8 TaxID=1817815 RepID=A0A1F4XM95_9BACT|nr:MAG: hypothetical protein A2788_00320 [Candidatus Abawacabacteria bacterium RIFCSPHIGHO2_01_FULL_46_8]
MPTAELQQVRNIIVGKHILVVDQDKVIREVIGDRLTSQEAKVTGIASVRDALPELDQHNFHLVITDLYRGEEITGLDLLSCIRTRGLRIPIILISDDFRQEDLSKAHQLGASALAKPFKHPQLVARIRTLLLNRN